MRVQVDNERKGKRENMRRRESRGREQPDWEAMAGNLPAKACNPRKQKPRKCEAGKLPLELLRPRGHQSRPETRQALQRTVEGRVRRQPCALVAVGYLEKKSGGPLRQTVRTGLVCLCCDALYSRGPQSINARSVWAQTRHNSRESIGIRDALIMYAVRIARIHVRLTSKLSLVTFKYSR